MKIDTIFSNFAKGAATVLSAKKDWNRVKSMSKDKNADVWANVWIKTARPAAISALKSSKLGLSDKDIEDIANDYSTDRKIKFVKWATDTDISRLKKLSKTRGDLEGDINGAGISSPSRRELIERNEPIEAAKEFLRRGYALNGYTKKRWKTTSNNPCEVCRSHEGETKDIDQRYSNGSMTAHAHPNCECEDEYIL